MVYLAQFVMYIIDIKLNDGQKLAIFNLMKLTFFRVQSSFQPHILFLLNSLALRSEKSI